MMNCQQPLLYVSLLLNDSKHIHGKYMFMTINFYLPQKRDRKCHTNLFYFVFIFFLNVDDDVCDVCRV